MQKGFLFLVIVPLLYTCGVKNENNMTDEEVKLIREAGTDSAFQILQVTDNTSLEFLRKQAQDIDVAQISTDSTLHLLIERMKTTLYAAKGVGLAAPQIGISRKLFLFIRLDQGDLYPIQVAINPEIVDHSGETFCFERDGCLSIPDISGNSVRYSWVDVAYYDEKGDLKQERLLGGSRQADFTGIIFQHEYDHLQGILFTDKLCDDLGGEKIE